MYKLYIPQNSNHVKNTVCQLHGENNIVIDITSLMGEEHDLHVPRQGVVWIKVPPVFGDSFYSLSRLKQLATVLVLKKSFSEYISRKNVSEVVIYNDGAFQRMLIDSLESDPDVVMQVDGLLYPPSGIKALLVKNIYRLMSHVGLGPYSPSYIGCYEKNSSINVVAESAKESLVQWGVDKNKISVKALPRYIDFLEKARFFREKIKADKGKGAEIRCTYFTSAFLWHGYKQFDLKQKEDLKEFVSFCEREGFAPYVRVHPRESFDRYVDFFKGSNVFLTCSSTPLYEDIILSRHLFTACSSTSLEAELLGKRMLVTRMVFSNEDFPGSFVNGKVIYSYNDVV